MRKRINLILLLTLIVFTGLSINFNPIKGSKVVYEFGSLRPNSTSLEVSESIKDDEYVSLVTKLSYSEFVPLDKPSGLSTISAINEYKAKVRKAGKDYHYIKNKELVSNIKICDYKDVYVSKYTPYVEYLYDKDTFINNKDNILDVITSNKDVRKINIITINKFEDKISDAIADSNGTEYINNGLYRGDGIKVGILETHVINDDHVNMTGIETHIYDNPWALDISSDHATAMATIIAHQSVGVAPDVSIYSACTAFGLSDEFDWFIENDVDVINMSFGEEVPDGVYSSKSALADYVSWNYGISMVAAVGNSGEADGYVGNPGLGYNVIGVGEYGGSNNVVMSSSRFEVVGPEKPNLIARGDAVWIPTFGCPGGTSVSCAVMTGFIACLMSQYPVLKIHPGEVSALVMANSYSLTGYTSSNVNGLNTHAGSGLFDLASASNSYSKLSSYNNETTTFTSERLLYTFPVYYSVGKTINVACFWPAKANGDEDETVFTTYRMDLCNTVGQVVRSTTCGNSNYMIIQNYDVLITGTYKVKVYQTSVLKNPYGDRVSVAFGSRYTEW